jgi:hypothetical protein
MFTCLMLQNVLFLITILMVKTIRNYSTKDKDSISGAYHSKCEKF